MAQCLQVKNNKQLRKHIQSSTVAHACDPSIWEAETGPPCQGQPDIYEIFKDGGDYKVRLLLSKTNKCW